MAQKDMIAPASEDQEMPDPVCLDMSCMQQDGCVSAGLTQHNGSSASLKKKCDPARFHPCFRPHVKYYCSRVMECCKSTLQPLVDV